MVKITNQCDLFFAKKWNEAYLLNEKDRCNFPTNRLSRIKGIVYYNGRGFDQKIMALAETKNKELMFAPITSITTSNWFTKYGEKTQNKKLQKSFQSKSNIEWSFRKDVELPSPKSLEKALNLIGF